MKDLIIILLFNVLCVSVQGATVEFAFQLGEKHQPRLDKLLPDVAQRMVFSSDNTKLIAKGMGGTVEILGVWNVLFSPNGKYLAVALWDATIQILH